MAEKKFVDANGVKVIKTDYVKRIGEKATELDGKISNKADSSALTALQTTVETDYLKSATAESTYAKQETVNQLAEKSGKVWFVSDDPVKTKEDLPTLKDTATKGEMFIISNDENHLYVFLGEGVEGADENGFRDLGTHVDLKDYLKSSDAANTYAQKATVDSIQETIDSLGDTYYTETEIDEKINGLGDTYYTETEVDEKFTALGDTYLTEADFAALSDSEIQEILQDE